MVLSSRRRFLVLSGISACVGALSPDLVRAATPPVPAEPLFRLRTWVTSGAHGAISDRYFDGPAWPPPRFPGATSGSFVEVHAAFPNSGNPFRIDTTKSLGATGFALATPDRALGGILPDDRSPDWLLNMIPFGVALDGSLLDPSGPWYDGGPADPNNPFDRACTGWEYEVQHPTVAALVGLVAEIGGHLQPGGLFHYHGYPKAMVSALRAFSPPSPGPLVVGYSADGYPIIDHRMTEMSGRSITLRSGYRLRNGVRTALPHTNPALVPEGTYNGLYVQDYVYDPPNWEDDTAISLDRRNGIVLGDGLPGIPGYPTPHYAYVLTPEWPSIPRGFAFRPADSFRAVIPLTHGDGLAGRLRSLVGPPTRDALYGNCSVQLADIHHPYGRDPY